MISSSVDSISECLADSDVETTDGLLMRRMPTCWEEALARASVAAKNYVCPVVQVAEASRKKIVVKEPDSPFEMARKKFFEEHEGSLRSSLTPSLGEPIFFAPIPLAAAPQNRFMESCGSYALIPALHGTHADNKHSIFTKGLLVPSTNNGLKVANGSVHGIGIYAALHNSYTSVSYSSDNRLLVCAVLGGPDDSVSHVGSGVFVVFDECRISPLYEVWGSNVSPAGISVPAIQKVRQVKHIATEHYVKKSGHPRSFVGHEKRRRFAGLAGFLLRRAACKRRQ